MNRKDHIDQRVFDLLNGAIDGELSVTGQEDLDKLLTGSDEVRVLNEEMRAVARLLDDLPEIEPPQYLRETIERQIKLPLQNKPPVEKQGFFGAWLPTHWLRTGFALAAGAVLTVGVYEMGSEPITPRDATSLVGTVVKSPATDQGELLDSIHVSTNTLNGLVELRNKNGLYSLDVQLDSSGPSEMLANFSSHELTFEGITRKQDLEDVVSVTAGSVNVASSGVQRYVLKLRRTATAQQSVPLELKFFANKVLVQEASLRISQQ